jgi:hypothetical protein
MSTWHVSNEVRNKIASTGPLGQAWLDELARDTSGDVDGHPAMTADVEEVEVVVAHQERITLRVGDVFVKLDADRSRLDVEVEAMTMPPVPTPEILWRKPHELALAALPGTALGRLGQPSPSSPAAWAAAGAAVRTLHDAPLPPWRSRKLDGLASQLDSECEWFVANEVLPADVVTHNRRLAEGRSGRRRRCSCTATCRSATSSSTVTRSPASSIGPKAARATRCGTSPSSRWAPRAPRRRRRRLRHRRRPRRGPRVVVVALPAGDPLAGRARLRSGRGVSRGRPAEVPAVRLDVRVGPSGQQRLERRHLVPR